MEWRKADVFWEQAPTTGARGEVARRYEAGAEVVLEGPWLHVRDGDGSVMTYPSSRVDRIRWWDKPVEVPVHPALAD